jgi:DNA-directed RNA polymerase subunit N (RpoN/RPB10)
MLPVRCFTCNGVIGHMWDTYVQAQRSMGGKESLDSLGLRRVCCRRMLLAHVPVIDDTILFSRKDWVLDESGTEMLCDAKNERVLPCT